MHTPRGLIWVFGIAIVALQFAAIAFIPQSAGQILLAGIPTLGGLIGADVWKNPQAKQ